MVCSRKSLFDARTYAVTTSLSQGRILTYVARNSESSQTHKDLLTTDLFSCFIKIDFPSDVTGIILYGILCVEIIFYISRHFSSFFNYVSFVSVHRLGQTRRTAHASVESYEISIAAETGDEWQPS